MSLFKKFFNPSSDRPEEEIESEFNNSSSKITLPIDEKFISCFQKNGGKFLYCENLSELKEQFENILEENDWFESEAICNDPKLFHLLDENRINYIKPTEVKFLFSSCESLIADKGSVLLSSNQIKQNRPEELPANIVIFATTSQIIETENDGLRMINKKYYKKDYPSNITTISYFKKETEEDFLHYGSSAKNLYLLLLEDL